MRQAQVGLRNLNKLTNSLASTPTCISSRPLSLFSSSSHLASRPATAALSSLLYRPQIPSSQRRTFFSKFNIFQRDPPRKMPEHQVNTEITKNLELKNEKYAKAYSPENAKLMTEPKKRYAIVTCMDSRIHVSPAFGLDLGDAHIIRNAGGCAKEALRSLVVSQQLLKTQEIVLIKHTQCGLQKFSNNEIHDIVCAKLGHDTVKDIDFMAFTDLEEAVKQDVAFLRNCKLIPENIPISGWTFDVETGKVKRIV